MNDGTQSEIVCANPDCKVAEDGKCVEGVDRDKCTFYGRSAAAEAVPAAKTPGLQLPSAASLDMEQASWVLCAGITHVTAIVGPRGAGKTSLIGGLYDLFQDGPIDDVMFVGSRSLHAFELCCHDARAASRRNTPHTERTGRGEVRFYHVDLCFEGDRRAALLLADRAGEEYLEAVDDISTVASFPEISRADSIVFLVDGERLLDDEARHNVRSNTVMIIQALIDGGGLQKAVRCAVVLTKIDSVEDSEQRLRAKADFGFIVADIRRLFTRNFLEVAEFEIAAFPKSESVQRGSGIARLLTYWLQPIAPDSIGTFIPSESSRMFGRLKPLAHEDVT